MLSTIVAQQISSIKGYMLAFKPTILLTKPAQIVKLRCPSPFIHSFTDRDIVFRLWGSVLIPEGLRW